MSLDAINNSVLRQMYAAAKEAMISTEYSKEDSVIHSSDERGTVISGRKWVVLGSRSDEFKAANLRTRQLFFKNITKLFGGKDGIPPEVLEEFKMEDFQLDKSGNVTSKRPLTARRIIAICEKANYAMNLRLANELNPMAKTGGGGARRMSIAAARLEQTIPADTRRAMLAFTQDPTSDTAKCFMDKLHDHFVSRFSAAYPSLGNAEAGADELDAVENLLLRMLFARSPELAKAFDALQSRDFKSVCDAIAKEAGGDFGEIGFRKMSETLFMEKLERRMLVKRGDQAGELVASLLVFDNFTIAAALPAYFDEALFQLDVACAHLPEAARGDFRKVIAEFSGKFERALQRIGNGELTGPAIREILSDLTAAAEVLVNGRANAADKDGSGLFNGHCALAEGLVSDLCQKISDKLPQD